METIVISPEFQVEIPRSARKTLKIRAGQKVQVIVYEDRIEALWTQAAGFRDLVGVQYIKK